MGAQGTATLDFGAFPGASDASVAVTGQTGIVTGSLVEAWLYPADTGTPGTATFHTADEHLVVPMKVTACRIVGGTGFTIVGVNMDPISEPLLPTKGNTNTLAGGLSAPQLSQQPTQGGAGTRIWGTWTIGWVWN